jgi:hypothetical protein
MRVLFAAAGLLAMSLGSVYAGESKYRIEYVQAYACPSRETIVELDKHLTMLDRMLFAVKWAGGTVPTVRDRIKNFNDKLDLNNATCLLLEQHVLIRTVDVYRPVWLAEGFPAFVVEMRLPTAEVEESEWPTYYGLKTNEEFDCNVGIPTRVDDFHTTQINSNCGIQEL